MKRFHVHLHVDDLGQSVGFYSKLFATAPARLESDYAKWLLQDPPLNFAISTRGARPGIDHLGIQTDDAAELAAMKAQAEAADLALLDEGETTCCYARSAKHWVTDPQGIAWEHFHTLGNITVFHEAAAQQAASGTEAAACCAATPREQPVAAPAKRPAASCC
ncbi:MAG TPA: ArsI/CadI family heavy metal resistance metalloenzyme [Burkholderiaceae bacterium]|nr:ArsI/CadI family heavy metal resistance metalloenzyme [Burkholderiaceae bacterium]